MISIFSKIHVCSVEVFPETSTYPPSSERLSSDLTDSIRSTVDFSVAIHQRPAARAACSSEPRQSRSPLQQGERFKRLFVQPLSVASAHSAACPWNALTLRRFTWPSAQNQDRMHGPARPSGLQRNAERAPNRCSVLLLTPSRHRLR